jgi:hypothetical protein
MPGCTGATRPGAFLGGRAAGEVRHRRAGHEDRVDCRKDATFSQRADDPPDVARGEELDPASGRAPGGSIPAATVADGITGFRAAPGRELRTGQAAVRTLWRVDGGAVKALARVTGQPAVVAAAGSDGIRLLDAASGSLARPVLAGPAAAVASLVLPDGGAVIAAAGEGEACSGGMPWPAVPSAAR